MAADMKWIQGEVTEDPTQQDADVERLLRGFVRALMAEQKPAQPNGSPETPESKNA